MAHYCPSASCVYKHIPQGPPGFSLLSWNVSVIIATIASLAGVVIGAAIGPWLQYRSDLRRLFHEALGALAMVAASQNYPSKVVPGGIDDPNASAELVHRMHDEFIAALLDARRALALVTPLCPEVRPYLNHWQDVQQRSVMQELEQILLRGLRRRLRIPIR